MEVCPETELMAIEDPATICDGSFEIGEGLEAQMIRHMRHGSSPRLIALQPILSLNRRESLPTRSAGDRMRRRRVNPTIRGMAGGSLLGPDSPDGLASGCPLALFVEQLQRLMQREAVRFAFTRCIHRDWALSDGISSRFG